MLNYRYHDLAFKQSRSDTLETWGTGYLKAKAVCREISKDSGPSWAPQAAAKGWWDPMDMFRV